MLALGSVALVAQADDPAPPAAIAGTWDVIGVQVDRMDAMHAQYRQDDPRLMGRVLTIEAGKVQFRDAAAPRPGDNGGIGCRQTQWPRWKTQWGTLFHQAFIRAPSSYASAHPTIEDFHLKAPAQEPVTAFALCPSSESSPAQRAKALWVVQYQKDKLLLREDPQYVLLFARRAPDAKPVASFDCTTANTQTEKAICGDYELASWDRSVARALKDLLQAWPVKEPALRASQTDYLKKRTACGIDRSCIAATMSWRIEELIMQMNVAGP